MSEQQSSKKLSIEHGFACIRDETGWLLWSERLDRIPETGAEITEQPRVRASAEPAAPSSNEPVRTFHIDSRGLVMEARGMTGPYVATRDYLALASRTASEPPPVHPSINADEVCTALGEIMGDFADRELIDKADAIGSAIALIRGRAAPPPVVVFDEAVESIRFEQWWEKHRRESFEQAYGKDQPFALHLDWDKGYKAARKSGWIARARATVTKEGSRDG